MSSSIIDDPSLLHRLHENVDNIRNVCILAHVDHGKTTLADSLIAANGIISARMIGKLRYMDSRMDEQVRGITMKTSAISLHFNDYLINLVDSPGHVDFCGEVSSATVLCDAAILLVDVVEGVCPQTESVLRQACRYGLSTILVLNKIDRLIVELKMTPTEAFRQMNNIIEQMNSIASQMLVAQLADNNDDDVEWSTTMDACEARVYYAPTKGNVLFASASDGWAFSINDFVNILSTKMPQLSVERLRERLYDADYYYSSKKQEIISGASKSDRKPLFVQLVLDSIWSVYRAIVIDKDANRTRMLCEQIGVMLNARDERHADPNVRVCALMQAWLPLARCVLTAICTLTPSPIAAFDARRLDSLVHPDDRLHPSCESIARCDRSQPAIVYVSKMVAVERRQLNARKPLTIEQIQARRTAVQPLTTATVHFGDPIETVDESSSNDGYLLLGFARVLAGVIHAGDRLFVRSTRTIDAQSVVIGRLYVFMGRELHAVDEIGAGNLVGISGLDDVILKTASLSAVADAPLLAPVERNAEPIVRVCIEPRAPSQLDALRRGLRLLNQADPCVHVFEQDTGELALVTSGEMHLQRCITDLKERFACDVDELIVSEPIVPFMETIVDTPSIDVVNELITVDRSNNEDSIEISTANKMCRLRIRALAIKNEIIDVIRRNESILELLANRQRQLRYRNNCIETPVISIETFHRELIDCATKCNSDLLQYIDRIWSFGPKRARFNILINATANYRSSIWLNSEDESSDDQRLSSFATSIITGFQMRCMHGPLCREPIRGVAFIIDDWTMFDQPTINNAELSGQLMSICKRGCKLAFQARPQRLMAAMYSCVIQANNEVLGKVYAVISKRKGRVLSDDINAGSNLFEVIAVLPVVESFGFCDEMRKKTSGLALPQLTFSHWEVLEMDPFWVPTTDEEVAHFGEKSDSDNLARKYMNMVRRRKGLPTDEQIVASAEKQRTLNKKK